MNLVIPSVFRAIDQMTKPIQQMKKAVSGLGTEMQTSNARAERSWRKFSSGMARVGAGAAIGAAAILGPLAAATNQAIEFEKQMGDVATLIDTNAESMKQMGQDVLSVANTIPKPIDELTKGLYMIRSAGIKASMAMGTLQDSGKLAVAGLSTVDEAVNITTSAMNAFKMENLSSAKATDILFKTVKSGKTTIAELNQGFGATAPIIASAKIAFSDFQAATAALTTVGTPASQAQNQIRAAIVALMKPTSDMEKIFKKIGVKTVPDLIKKYGNMGDAFKAIESAGKKMGINMAQAWSSVEASAAVTSLVGQTNEAYIKTLEDMKNGTNALEEAFMKQLGTTSSQAQLMKNNLSNLAITIGTELLPYINDLIKAVLPVMKGIGKWMHEHPKLTKAILLTTGVIGGLLTVLSLMAVAIWAVNIALAANPIVWIIAAVIGLIAIIALAVDSFDTWGESVLLMMGPIGWLVDGIVRLYRWIKEGSSHYKGWGEQWDATLDWMKSILNVFVLGAKLHFQVVFGAFSELVDAMVRAWKWGQNKLGVISDEQYAKDIKRINEESKARVAAIKNTTLQLAQEMDKVAKGPGWHIQAKTEVDYGNEARNAAYDQANIPFPERTGGRVMPAGNSKAAQFDISKLVVEALNKQKAEFTVNVPAGVTFEKTSGDAKVTTKTSPTTGSFNKQNNR